MELKETSEKEFTGIYKDCEVTITLETWGKYWPQIWSDKESCLYDSGDEEFDTLDKTKEWVKHNVDNNFVEFPYRLHHHAILCYSAC